jgi:lysozyme
MPQVSEKGLSLIKRWESLQLRAYQDHVGVWTIGWGHTSAAGRPQVLPGMEITEAQAEEILRTDLAKFERWVADYITRKPTRGQYDAMVSLCFNVGPRNFKASPVLAAFNAGDLDLARKSFLHHVKAGGKYSRGLENRRKTEQALFAG